MSVGVVINPRSAGNGRRGERLRQALRPHRHVLVEILNPFERLDEALGRLAAADVELVVISGGDGTVHAIQTWLGNSGRFAVLPRLAILPHGTTNMTAADVGLSIRDPEKVADFLSRPGFLRRATRLRSRPTVRVANAIGREPLLGMFLGTGAIYRAVVKCQRDVHRLGLKGELASAVTLVQALARALVGPPPEPGDPDRIDSGDPMTIVADGVVRASGMQLLFLATTLERLVLGTRPFWNQGGGKLHATAIAHPPRNILRNLPSVMYGGPMRRLREPDFVSFGADAIELEAGVPFVMDGELLEAPAGEPLRISTGPAFEYLCG